MAIIFSEIGRLGRLGNQMFQYAVLKSVASKNNFEFAIPSFEKHSLGNFLLKDYKIIQNLNTNKHQYNERFFHYDSNVFNIKDNTNLSGFFQTAKYFTYDVSIDFELKPEIKKVVDSFFSSFREKYKKEIVSIHVRRGDYLSKPLYHPVCCLNYYRKAMSQFENVKFLVFSDDIDWCKNNLVGDNIFYSNTKKEIYDLGLMMNCDHNIIANSSFSWWAAYLNKNNNKKVICPSVWFGPKGPKDFYDVYIKNWIKIENN